tara:strand:+ start:50787 stop:51524 length:738 start_codon:yes stop_codon:yes gene_type:complete
MNVTIFTSNNLRHNYLINKFAKVSNKVFVFQETRSIFPGMYESHYKKYNSIGKYFKYVDEAQNKIFSKKNKILSMKKINLAALNYGDLSFIQFNNYKSFFKSDYYLVFGSSYIKGDLLRFLKKKKAINIHMGISPYYKGTDCNFWALMDGNKKFVGATIHYLSEKLDGGPILSYAYASKYSDPFLFTMSSTKNAINKLYQLILKKNIHKKKINNQSEKKLIRYSTKKEFTDSKVKEFFHKFKIKW